MNKLNVPNSFEECKTVEKAIAFCMTKGGIKQMIIIDKAELVGHIAMWLYRLAPKHRPRKVDSIIDSVIKYVDDTFTAPLKSDPEFRTHDFENRDSLYSYIDTMMKSIKEFRELNLTWREYISGIDVDSPDRGGLCRPRCLCTGCYLYFA